MPYSIGKTQYSALLAVILFAAGCDLATAQGSNGTQGAPVSQDPRRSGWRDGPKERGTLGLVWSCLATIIACTWTILHLNVPRPVEGSWTTTTRKIKWMAITVLFPEFVFSKAVCELQSAVYDLQSMSEISQLDEWRVEFGRVPRVLFKLFKVFDEGKKMKDGSKRQAQGEDEQDLSWKRRRRTWTLTHSYFANMGGLVLSKNEISMPVTAKALANYCKGGKESFLSVLKLSADEIRDRSKADWFAKAIAFAQISWLVLSIIVRASREMPISQLEICTVSFAALALATYAANWSKPKDVNKPIIIEWDGWERRDARNKKGKHEEPFVHRDESFFERLLQPRRIQGDPHQTSLNKLRIKNDFIRKGSKVTDVPFISYWLAISTMAFGGMHCAAWGSNFPTHAERVVWMIASCLSATIPLLNLVFNNILLSWRANSSFQAVLTKLKQLELSSEETPEVPTQGTQNYRYGVVYVTAAKQPLVSLKSLHEAMFELFNDILPQLFAQTTPSEHMLNRFINQYEKAKLRYTRIQSVVPSLKFDRHSIAREGVKCLDDCDLSNKFLWRRRKHLIFVMDLLEQPNVLDILRKPLREIRFANRPARVITIFSGIVYGIVRVVILALAFATLRRQNDGVYVETWTKNLPNFN